MAKKLFKGKALAKPKCADNGGQGPRPAVGFLAILSLLLHAFAESMAFARLAPTL